MTSVSVMCVMQIKMHEAEVSIVDLRELHPLCIGHAFEQVLDFMYSQGQVRTYGT
jgi:hypothetical protein